ncbi:hypothetical protein HDV00_004717 [Rhizophlyctis rosea]|nr:hypothetical protein HDV00_004717 [Rhizophlyctis rosea]
MSATIPNLDVLITIFAALPVPTLLRCEQACRQWRDISRKETAAIWKPKILTAFPAGCLPVLWGRENWQDVVCLWWAWEKPWTPEVKILRPIKRSFERPPRDKARNAALEPIDMVTDSRKVLGLRPKSVMNAERLYKVPPQAFLRYVRPSKPISLPPSAFSDRRNQFTICGSIMVRHDPPHQHPNPPRMLYDFTQFKTGVGWPRLSVSWRFPIAFNETLAAHLEFRRDDSSVPVRFIPHLIRLCRISDLKIIATASVSDQSNDTNGTFIMTRFNLIVRDAIQGDNGTATLFNLKVYSLRDLTVLYELPLPFPIEIIPLNSGNVGLRNMCGEARYPDLDGSPYAGGTIFGASPRMLDPMQRALFAFDMWDGKQDQDTVVRVRRWEVDNDGERTGRPGFDFFTWWTGTRYNNENNLKEEAERNRQEGDVWVEVEGKGFCRQPQVSSEAGDCRVTIEQEELDATVSEE